MATRYNVLFLEDDDAVSDVKEEKSPIIPDMKNKSSWADECDEDPSFRVVTKKERKFNHGTSSCCYGKIAMLCTKNGSVAWGRVERQDTQQMVFFSGKELFLDVLPTQNLRVKFMMGANSKGPCAVKVEPV